MRFILNLISRLLGLVTLLFLLLYVYGLYLVKQVEKNERALETRMQSGNGFGGESGMKIIDSEYNTREFFWIDDDHLVFKNRMDSAKDGVNRNNYVWNVTNGEVLPIDIEGTASCARDDYFYFSIVVNSNRRSGERGIVEIFRSKLVRESGIWSVSEKRNIRDVWPKIPDGYKYAWQDGHQCKPKYYRPRENRIPSEVPSHYITYLSEWGWIYRRPHTGRAEPNTDSSQTGFYAIGQDIYLNQAGEWRAASPEIPDLRDFSISYVEFLDNYWIANRLNLDFTKPKYLGLLDRSGQLVPFAWSDDWPFYDAIPLPTRKGIFWDSRNPGTGLNNSGGYILAADNRVHKVIHGAAENPEVSPNGCRVAFFNRPKSSASVNSRLRIFDACNSSIQGREMTDVHYRNRTD